MDEPVVSRKKNETGKLWEPTSILFLILTILSFIGGMEAAFIIFGLMLFACVMRAQISRWIWGSSLVEQRPEEASAGKGELSREGRGEGG